MKTKKAFNFYTNALVIDKDDVGRALRSQEGNNLVVASCMTEAVAIIEELIDPEKEELRCVSLIGEVVAGA